MQRRAQLESRFQRSVIAELKQRFPGCWVCKQDEQYQQGIPDLIILFNDKWAMLETKRSSDASRRPNQEYYVDMFDRMSFASFISPENREGVMYDLQQSFEA